MMDVIFGNYFNVVSYSFFEGAMVLVIILEFGYTFFENWDVL